MKVTLTVKCECGAEITINIDQLYFSENNSKSNDQIQIISYVDSTHFIKCNVCGETKMV